MSFEQLISTASLGDGTKPKYQSIAEDLAQAILNGQVFRYGLVLGLGAIAEAGRRNKLFERHCVDPCLGASSK